MRSIMQKKSIDVAMYLFENRELADAIIRASKRKIAIRIVLDMEMAKEWRSQYKYLLSNGVPVRLSNSTMHNKFTIIDGKIVITGSYNWTDAAEKNEENVVFIRGENKVISEYQKRFDRIWMAGSDKSIEVKGKHTNEFKLAWHLFILVGTIIFVITIIVLKFSKFNTPKRSL